ncbi:Na+/H+ antiporter NhaA, partial [Streptomyces calidiresistens]|nr:Na+/H+ antiporter NhaA [Streptomyces calidiresistens]
MRLALSGPDPRRTTGGAPVAEEQRPAGAPEPPPEGEPGTPPAGSVFPAPLPLPESTRIGEALRTETVGGMVLLVSAALALILANTGLSDAYAAVRDFTFGPDVLHLHLSVAEWTRDGLLAVFFLVAGIELKRELVLGELRDPRAAAVPITAAMCGMIVPAVIYLSIALIGNGNPHGWAVPMATDIAFALGVLAVVGRSLPAALRAFLLTLAIVDDLGAIIVIAVFYPSDLEPWPLAAAVGGLVLFHVALRRGVTAWWLLAPLALGIWVMVHAGGIHATIAGVALGLLLRAKPRPGEAHSPADRVEHRIRPISAGFAVPAFALFAAGVGVSADDLTDVLTRPETLGVALGLLVGKPLGVVGGVWAATRFTRARLDPALGRADVLLVGLLAGIGFTVSLLIADLAFPDHPALGDEAKAAVLVGSLLSAGLAALLARLRRRRAPSA